MAEDEKYKSGDLLRWQCAEQQATVEFVDYELANPAKHAYVRFRGIESPQSVLLSHLSRPAINGFPIPPSKIKDGVRLVPLVQDRDRPDLVYITTTKEGINRTGIVKRTMCLPTDHGMVNIDLDEAGNLVGIELIGFNIL